MYRGLQPGEFMTKWLILGPVPVSAEESAGKDEQEQKKAFDTDPFSVKRFRATVKIGEKEFKWASLTSEGELVDLVQTLGQKASVTAYAWARIRMAEEMRILLGIGSDDAVKVWLNGKLIHENWVQRACTKDSDLVAATFRKGRNHLVLKIQNGTGDWAFSCRPLGPKALTEKLISSVRTGRLDPVKTLLEHGADVNGKVGPGLTVLHVARIAGRAEAAKLLLEKGADPNIDMPPKEKIIDWEFERVVKEKYPGAAVLVAKDSEVLYQNGYGYADIGHLVEVTPETIFRIGSISKQFTAAAILKLQEEGKLNVQDKLSKFLPDYPRGDEVTLHYLLTHTSGIHSYTNKPDFMKTVTVEIKAEELIDSFKDDMFEFDPGEKQSYCNSGYFLLGYIVEKVSGKSLGDYLKESFFDPLNMNETGIHHWNLILDHEATGYSYVGGKVQKAQNWDMSRAGGAGALYSTVGDLYRWNQALFSGKVLKESSLKVAFTPAKLNNGEIAMGTGSAGYGYGWAIGEIRGVKLISHGGGLHGFSSYLMQLPEKKFTVAVLANSQPSIPELSSSGFAHQIAEIYLFKEMEQRVSFIEDKTVDPTVYDDYVGRYDYGDSMVLTVTRQGDRLLAQLSGQGQAEIFPRSENEFFWKEVDAQITFVRNKKGKVTGAVHHQGGRTLKVPKLKDEPVAKVDPAVYDAYVGEYEIENVGKLTVTKDDGHLYAQLASQPKFEVFPRSETEFFLKVVQADIIFTKDKDGRVTGLTLKQAGVNMTGKKVKYAN
jgi:CubicO group peptidase (beta-lactamase class C family)